MIKAILIVSLFLLQSPQADDAPEFPGQPTKCDNFKDTPEDMKCHCARDRQNCEGKLPEGPADVAMDKRCLTYCKKQHCECAGMGCRS